MSSFLVRIVADDVFREQLHLLAKQKKTSIGKLVEGALQAAYGQDLASLKEMASFFANPVPETVQGNGIGTDEIQEQAS